MVTEMNKTLIKQAFRAGYAVGLNKSAGFTDWLAGKLDSNYQINKKLDETNFTAAQALGLANRIDRESGKAMQKYLAERAKAELHAVPIGSKPNTAQNKLYDKLNFGAAQALKRYYQIRRMGNPEELKAKYKALLNRAGSMYQLPLPVR